MTTSTASTPTISIIGTRGIPAQHGGFETFAERLALHLRDRGWRVTVYCQVDEGSSAPIIDQWEGIRRVTFAAGSGAIGTMAFDWKCVMHARRERGVKLVLGYNTAVFSALLRFSQDAVLTNMDGIEWKRAKWPWHGRIWLYFNEWIGALTSTKLIADHPEIERHLRRRRSKDDIVMIPYGADPIVEASEGPVRDLGLTPGKYLISIGRMEPENNILPMVEAYSRRPREIQMVCLGKLEPATNAYHAEIISAGSDRVKFPGAIYSPEIIKSLRFHAAAYCHGHSVGGTNPSLVEALGAGNPVIAHGNKYNRWVCGSDQLFFGGSDDFERIIDRIESEPEVLVSASVGARKRHSEVFKWLPVLEQYEEICRAEI